MQSISSDEVTFENGDKEKVDKIILCTGYKIDLDFLSPNLKEKCFLDPQGKYLNVKFFILKLYFSSKISD